MLDLRETASSAYRHMSRTIGRRRFVASIRPTDIFVVSYPKSGTTWLSFMLAEVLNHGRSQLNLKTAWSVVPDINDLYFGAGDLKRFSHIGEPRVFSVHAPYDPALRRVIYVIRDPRDVMVSYYHYKQLTVPEWDTPLIDFLSQPQQWPCSWEAHVRGWVEQRAGEILLVRYEDIHRDGASVLRAALNFAAIPYQEADIERSLDAGSFKQMRTLEETFGFEGAQSSDEKFVRRGKVGGWRDELSMTEQHVLQEEYGGLAGEFGFELQDDLEGERGGQSSL